MFRRRTRAKMWSLTGVAVLSGMMTAGSLVNAAPASAEYVLHGQFQNWQSGACLDSNANGVVYTLPCQNGNNYQRWEVTGSYGHSLDSSHSDQVRIRNVATGLCLNMYAEDDGKTLWLLTDTCSATPSTSLSELIDGRGPNWNNVQLRNSYYYPDTCLDSHGVGDAYPRQCNYGTYQTWRLIYRY
jgi:hypothetical protein